MWVACEKSTVDEQEVVDGDRAGYGVVGLVDALVATFWQRGAPI